MSGIFDHTLSGHEHISQVGEGLAHAGDDHLALSSASHGLGSPPAGGMLHGSPGAAESYWFTQSGETCLPASVTQVVAEVTGHEPTVQDAITRMHQLHLPIGPDGTPDFKEAQRLLQDGYGVPCHVQDHASLSDLEHYLDQNRSVILQLNAEHVWGTDAGSQQQEHADHVVLITSIDENATASDGTRGVVTLSDTGTPNGNEEHVPLHVFQEAWAAGHNELLVTDTPAHPDDPHPTPAGPILLPVTLNPEVFDHPAPSIPSPTQPDVVGPQTHLVAPGDTLWGIAEQAYGEGSQFQRIADANGITDPGLIYPGEVLTIPN